MGRQVGRSQALRPIGLPKSAPKQSYGDGKIYGTPETEILFRSNIFCQKCQKRHEWKAQKNSNDTAIWTAYCGSRKLVKDNHRYFELPTEEGQRLMMKNRIAKVAKRYDKESADIEVLPQIFNPEIEDYEDHIPRRLGWKPSDTIPRRHEHFHHSWQHNHSELPN